MPDNDIDTTRSTEVLVVGAGPTGLMTALLLHRSGIQIRILDKNDQQAHESRAFALQARSLELLLNLGIVDAFIEQATITPGMQIYVNGHKAAEANLTDIGANDSPYAFLLMLPQSKIEKLLAAELEKEGITVEHNMEVTTFAQDDSGVAVTAINKQGEEIHIHADYVVGADGGHSVIRHGLGLTFDGHAYTQSFMLADCSIHWPLDYAFGKIFLRGTSLAIYLPMDGQKMGRIIAVTPDKNLTDSIASKDATTAEPLELAEVQKALRDASGLEITLSDPAWVTRYRIHHRGTNQYGVGRIYIAGDAAHIHSPMGGQGMNTGLQDAANLAWKLALRIKNHGDKNLLDTYNAERWPIGKKLLNFTDKLFSRISSQSPMTAAIRNTVMPWMMKMITSIPRCRYNAFRFISELGIRYHENTFLQDDISQRKNNPPKRLRPGYRAPNATYKRNHDIFGLIRGYQFHVLALSRKALSPEEIETTAGELETLPTSLGLPLTTHFIAHSATGQNENIIQAETNEVFNHYGVTDRYPFGLFLIRPDGYIAYRSDTFNVAKLKKFCEMFAN